MEWLFRLRFGRCCDDNRFLRDVDLINDGHVDFCLGRYCDRCLPCHAQLLCWLQLRCIRVRY